MAEDIVVPGILYQKVKAEDGSVQLIPYLLQSSADLVFYQNPNTDAENVYDAMNDIYSRVTGLVTIDIGTSIIYQGKDTPSYAKRMDGSEIKNCETKYPAFWKWVQSSAETCTFEEYDAFIESSDQCKKFGVDGSTVRLPTLKVVNTDTTPPTVTYPYCVFIESVSVSSSQGSGSEPSMDVSQMHRVGTPEPLSSTLFPSTHKPLDGSLVMFSDYPMLEAKYRSGGLVGMTLPFNATEEQKQAEPFKFVEDGETVTGLYMPNLPDYKGLSIWPVVGIYVGAKAVS